MTLNVPWSDFPEEVKARIGPSARVYLTHQDGTTVATAGEPRLGIIVHSTTRQPYTQVLARLEQEQLKITTGHWSLADQDGRQDVCIAAVAYVSNEETPGLWVEAFPFQPDISDVISRIMEEFRREGALENVTAEQFAKLAKPNVVVLTQHEITTLLEHYERESHVTPHKDPSEDQTPDQNPAGHGPDEEDEGAVL